MTSTEWYIFIRLAEQPSAPKKVVHFSEAEHGGTAPGSFCVSKLKQKVAASLPETVPEPDLFDLVYCGRKLKDEQTLDFYGIQPGSAVYILKKSWPEPDLQPEPVDRTAAAREFRVLQAALHTSPAYRDSVFKMLNNKESLDQIIIATPGLSSDPVALGVLRDKDLFSLFTDSNMLDTLIVRHPALVNAIILVLHSVAGSLPPPQTSMAPRDTSSASYSSMPGGFLFEGLSDEEDDFQMGNHASSSSESASGSRPASLGYSGATGPRPITQSELATALALASTPESSAVTPTTSNQGASSGASPVMSSSGMPAGTPITNDIFSQALQQALQVSTLQAQWQSQLQQLQDMGIQDEELILRALQATGGDIQAALELIFAGGAP
ncbi:ubiquitin-like protein 7a isoform X2 [Erpetoichthys calabaricus]|uniref:Ubiquitin-like 7a (bone marrow stromal cell-derived) n=1 Tax=Erpetoichthys calabaricus TaxID=27687 RepID=A0A8C4THP3_ERPCA|nr:ubiquitin-like protein 7a isoform X1 [Erpetoichthys calabaricus]XP_028679199.1 ubiquitin-like protein 7a isoform X1 [Erpetoichthys calabaricus]XP_051776761.1 ubiquitin-like protein 7a isoform X2 [Erpetoichthys calabaricus]